MLEVYHSGINSCLGAGLATVCSAPFAKTALDFVELQLTSAGAGQRSLPLFPLL